VREKIKVFLVVSVQQRYGIVRKRIRKTDTIHSSGIYFRRLQLKAM
jgi:hypothetical protein